LNFLKIVPNPHVVFFYGSFKYGIIIDMLFLMQHSLAGVSGSICDWRTDALQSINQQERRWQGKNKK
jgi:hypothetical protein